MSNISPHNTTIARISLSFDIDCQRKAFKGIDLLVIVLSSNQTSVSMALPELHALYPASSRVRKHKATILLLSIIVLYFIYDRSCQVSNIANLSGKSERERISVAQLQLSSKKNNDSVADVPMVEEQQLRIKTSQEQMANHNSTTSVDNSPNDAVGEKVSTNTSNMIEQMENIPVDNKEGFDNISNKSISESISNNSSASEEQIHNNTVPLERANAENPVEESALSLSNSVEEQTSNATSSSTKAHKLIYCHFGPNFIL